MPNSPNPDKRLVNFRLHRDLIAAAKATAARHGEDLTTVIERALTDYIGTGAGTGTGQYTAPRTGDKVTDTNSDASGRVLELQDQGGVASALVDTADGPQWYPLGALEVAHR